MPEIELKTQIQAPVDRCFDLSRSIDLHMLSTQQTNEIAVAGVITGLIGLNESVTWKARHFGVWQKLTSEITEFKYPDYFVDEMVKGAFKSFRHEHYFKEKENNMTEMIDKFSYESPLGILGSLADKLFLKRYMTDLLDKRNQTIKEVAESDRWKEILNKK